MTHPMVRGARGRRGRGQEPEELPPLRERLKALRYVPPLLRMVWETHRGYAAAILVLRICRAFIPLGTLWVGKLIIDEVIRAAAHGGSLHQLFTYVGMELGFVVAGELLERSSNLCESLLGDLFANRISIRLMEHASTLDLYQFEDPAFYDHLERARRGTTGRIGM